MQMANANMRKTNAKCHVQRIILSVSTPYGKNKYEIDSTTHKILKKNQYQSFYGFPYISVSFIT